MSDIDDLLREMDREGDGWYGRASSALQSQREQIEHLENELDKAKLLVYQLSRDKMTPTQEYLLVENLCAQLANLQATINGQDVRIAALRKYLAEAITRAHTVEAAHAAREDVK